MPAVRSKDDGAPCRARNRHGKQVLLRSLPAGQLEELDKAGKQYKYHENVQRYIGKRIDIRGEYGYKRPAVPSPVDTARLAAPLRPADLKLARIFGEGGFGAVGIVMVEETTLDHKRNLSGAQIAVKICKKRELRNDAPSDDAMCVGVDAVHDLLNLERRNLATLEWNPFIAGLFTCIQDSKNLYQLMELGYFGSLKDVVAENGALPVSVCRFYFANLVRITEFLHGIDMIHGDLKPENIVIGADGYLMLCDFGISAFRNEERNWNNVGTTAYSSPEALQGNITDATVESIDWWAVACILYEMATGRAVFRYLKWDVDGDGIEERKAELVDRIIECKWWWPRNLEVDPVLKDLVEKLLEPELDKRIGCLIAKPAEGPLKNEDIRGHPFMRSFPWKKLGEKKLAAPFVPTRTPRPSEDEWHSKPLPKQKDVPGITVKEPAAHLRWDRRFRRKKDEGRQECEQQVEAWNKEMLRQSRDAHIASMKAKESRPDMGSATASEQMATGHRGDPVQTLADEAVRNVRKSRPSTSQQRQPSKDIFRATPSPSIPGPSRQRPVGRTSSSSSLQDGMKPQSVQGKQSATEQAKSGIALKLPSNPRVPIDLAAFRMPGQIQSPKPQFKEPMLPERILAGEFGKLAVGSSFLGGRESGSSENAGNSSPSGSGLS